MKYTIMNPGTLAHVMSQILGLPNHSQRRNISCATKYAYAK